MRLLVDFDGFEQEQQLVGRMLMAYGELEFEIAHVMGRAIEGGNDAAARLLFRVSGEGPRIDVADAILRPFFDKMNLSGQWACTIGALRYCKNARNQYAHCNWHSEEGGSLSFVNMDRDADSPEGTLNLQLYPVDLALLQKQHEYFEYALGCLYYLLCQCRLRSGEESPDQPIPKSIPQPPLSNRPKKPPQSPAACQTPKAHPEE